MKTKDKTHIIAIISILVGSIGVIILFLGQIGFFTSPDIRFQKQTYSDTICPQTLDIYSGNFDINFVNIGNKGADISAHIQSPDNISFVSNTDNTNIPPGQNYAFRFIINPSSLKTSSSGIINNCTINIIGEYKAGILSSTNSITYACKYKKVYNSLLLAK